MEIRNVFGNNKILGITGIISALGTAYGILKWNYISTCALSAINKSSQYMKDTEFRNFQLKNLLNSLLKDPNNVLINKQLKELEIEKVQALNKGLLNIREVFECDEILDQGNYYRNFTI